ncbi:MAG: hypothetical protein ABI220_01945 [Candidatus Saccharimonadales bacterium]
MANTNTQKDTIYIDIDDEITSIIDKVRSAEQKVVALVLPKRATVLQSIVNMKLLKRSAEEAKKSLVLITSEKGLLPLAGNVGLYVASTLQSKPAIPKPPDNVPDEPEEIEEPAIEVGSNKASAEESDDFDPEASANTAVGALAAKEVVEAPVSDVDDSFELDNSDGALDEDADSPAKPAKSKDKNKKLKIPNFNSFRKKLIIAIAVIILLVAAYIYGFMVMPKATIAITTDSSRISTNLNVVVDTAATKLNTDGNVIPAISQGEQKSYTQQVPATGQKNNGQRATGSVSMSTTNCNGKAPIVAAGTGVSSGGLTYITQETAHFTPKLDSDTTCYFSSDDVSITGQTGGEQYNVSGAKFSVAGYTGVSATGSASGGTDQIIKVVSQTDIDTAKNKISTTDISSVKTDLQTALKAKALIPIPVTLVIGDPQTTTSANVGDATDSVAVTQVIGYTMIGVNKSDLTTLIEGNIKSQIDPKKQTILDNGVDQTVFDTPTQESPNRFSLSLSAKSVAGPDLDKAAIKAYAAGKKAGDIRTHLKSIPGVSDVDVKYSPFWVTSTPKNIDKINLQLDKSGS